MSETPNRSPHGQTGSGTVSSPRWQALETKTFFRRRRLILDNSFQYQMLMLTLGYIIFYALVISVTLFLPPVIVLLSKGTSSGQTSDSMIQLLYLHQRLWPVTFMTLIAFGLHSVYTTHRMAGPLYRIRKTLETIKNGTLPKAIHLRKGDFFQREADLLNETMEELSTRVTEMYTIHDGLVDGISRYREALRAGRAEEAEQLLEELNVKSKSPRGIAQFEIES